LAEATPWSAFVPVEVGPLSATTVQVPPELDQPAGEAPRVSPSKLSGQEPLELALE